MKTKHDSMTHTRISKEILPLDSECQGILGTKVERLQPKFPVQYSIVTILEVGRVV